MAVPRSDLTPDSPLASKVHPSPNHGERRDGRRPDMLLLHYTGMPTAAGALARLCDATASVSAHYLVFEDGRVLQLVPEGRRAWHAGAGSWAGETDINSCSIGIEIVHPGHAGGLPPYPEAQIASVAALSGDIVRRWSIRPERVLAHSDVAPSRKEDPGENFPWANLHGAGVGHWTDPAPIRDGRVFAAGDQGPSIEALQALFALYGYPIELNGIFDETTTAVVTAFQRHFRQERVDGRVDASTIATLRALIETLPSSPAG
ncbi:N-acetylmuramoyl-L-alanine amidase [Enterovirga rhinocerotis]|uniref:N-acetylmuramoyl-L-alanine amidase n=1 Tax=Enterovirga rhinocerotis TaxID=1339210 RepID=A0A4R7BR39_9HYPH|nr:N-acetylmuramoyl-L-alanine amidase [Enterovirga rhinocerotis]TDR88144.1 N-acetylmuramoyl-L-alanine amidase [Enterovirga rhinocerotis]